MGCFSMVLKHIVWPIKWLSQTFLKKIRFLIPAAFFLQKDHARNLEQNIVVYPHLSFFSEI